MKKAKSNPKKTKSTPKKKASASKSRGEKSKRVVAPKNQAAEQHAARNHGATNQAGKAQVARGQSATAAAVERELRKHIRPDKAEFMPKFMQAYPGGYGEGDQFLGVMVPHLRSAAKQFSQMPLNELSKLIQSKWHECRLTAVYLLVLQFEKAQQLSARGKPAEPSPAELVQFYLDHLDNVNNWDLVDASAHKILGPWILEHPKEVKTLRKLANSKELWKQRVSVIATLAFIRNYEFDELLNLSRKFLNHPHDLMHKAVGWMLREMGKRDVNVLRGFLSEHSDRMPRTMLRYSIEKLSRAERDQWLGKDSVG